MAAKVRCFAFLARPQTGPVRSPVQRALLWTAWLSLTLLFSVFAIMLQVREDSPWTSSDYWEEPSMNQYQFRGKLFRNFKGHWSIRISLKTRQRGLGPFEFLPEIHMDQWLPNLSESSGLHRHRSTECSSLSVFVMLSRKDESMQKHLQCGCNAFAKACRPCS